VRASEALALRERPARVLLNGRVPEGEACAVRLRDPDDPSPGEAIPEKKRGLTANTGATVATENEELGDV
jgi:hypothetical protein